jgi:hypothetical protein
MTVYNITGIFWSIVMAKSVKTRAFISVKEIMKRVKQRGLDMSDINTQYDVAFQIATSAHFGVRQHNGRAYIEHPVIVATANTRSTTKKIIGLLHDVVEDSKWTLAALRKIGFSERVVLGVEAMTKKPGELYFDFVERCSLNTDARDKKIEDLTHNLDESRNDRFVTEETMNRMNKYKIARAYLVAIKKGKIEAGHSIVDFVGNHKEFGDSLTAKFLLTQHGSRTVQPAAMTSQALGRSYGPAAMKAA